MATFLARALDLTEIEILPRPYTLDVVSRESWGLLCIASGNAGTSLSDGQTLPITSSSAAMVGSSKARRIGLFGTLQRSTTPRGRFLIVVEGDYGSEIPSPQQLEALAQMVAWASTTFEVSIDTISGHRDHAATSCPGDNLYAKAHDGTITERAQTILDEGGVSLSIGSA